MKKIYIILIFLCIILFFIIYNLIIAYKSTKIEAASAFYPFTSSLMQNIYGREDMVVPAAFGILGCYHWIGFCRFRSFV